MATILTKKSDTSSSVPLAADLTNAAGGAELAVNTADKRLYSKTSGGSVVELGTNPSALSLPNGTANGVPYLNGSKVLTSGSALQFDGSNLGLGVTPTQEFSTSRAFQIGGGLIEGRTNDSITFSLASNAYLSAAGNWTYRSNNRASLFELTNGTYAWKIAGAGTGTISFTQAMTLDASGNLLVGTTTSRGKLTVESASGSCRSVNVLTGSSTIDSFTFNGGAIGSITTNGVSTFYNTSSDYRLKEDIAPMTGALAKVAQLKPVTYKWKADGSDGEGFIAHELAEVCPAAVTGEKDAVDKDGKPQYQGIDVSFLIGTLTAAIQEQQALITSLTARLAALESK